MTSSVRHLPFLLAVATVLPAGSVRTAYGAEGIDNPSYWESARAKLSAGAEGTVAWETNREGRWRIYAVPLAGGQPRRISEDDPDAEHYAPHISPDGRHLVYVSMSKGSSAYGKVRGKVKMHLVELATGKDRTVIPDVRVCSGGDRSATWIDERRFYFIGGDGKARVYDIKTQRTSEPVLTNGKGHLPNATGEYAADRHRYYRMDLKKRTLGKAKKRYGGCEPYFSRDGRWGIRMSGAGGPAHRVRLSDGKTKTIIAKKDPRLPAKRRYVYFPMLSPCQRLFAYGASENKHNHSKSDYDIFLVPVDPDTLMLDGRPVRITFHSSTDRYPTVWMGDLELKEHRGEAPLKVTFTHKRIRSPGRWTWNYGKGQRSDEPAEHVYRKPGAYTVFARRDGETLRGRVVVRTAEPPRLLSVFVASPRELKAVFSEPIDADRASVKLASGTAVVKTRAKGRQLIVTLAKQPANPDTIHLSGVRDRAQSPNTMEAAKLELRRHVWPAVRKGLVYALDTAQSTHVITANGKERTPRLTRHGRAHFDRHHALSLTEGAVSVDEQASAALLKELKPAGALTLEAIVTTRSPNQGGPARIVTFSSGSRSRNFTLGQQKSNLVLRLRTPKTGGNGTRPSAALFALPPGEPVHVVVTYHKGRLRAYRNGQPVTKTDKVRGDFSNWKKQDLLFGDESGGERNWNGTLEGIAIYRRALSDDDVKRQWQAVRAKLALRKPVKTHRVRARVTQTSTPPTRKQIGNYTNALLVHRLRVTKVIQGKKHLRAGQQITVADWAILNDKTQPAASWKKGQTLTLTLQPFDRQAQLKSLYIVNEIGDGLEAPEYWNSR